MTDINPENAILAELLFGIGGIVQQMETVEALANRTALTVKQAFAQTELGAPINTKILEDGHAQAMAYYKRADAEAQGIIMETEARKTNILEKGQQQRSQSAERFGARMDYLQDKLAADAIMDAEAREIKLGEIEEAGQMRNQKIYQNGATQRMIWEKKADASILSQRQLTNAKLNLMDEKLLYMQSRRAAFEDKPTGMAGLMERRMSWLGTGALVMGGFTGIAETVQTIKDVEMGMTTIARVTEDAAFNFKGMRDELQQLGVTYGNTWENVSDIAIRWAQAGYDMAETTELTKSSLLALNTAELTSEQATSGMIAIMAQWGLTAEELLPTIDKINKVADDFAITSTDLVSGLTRSSGAAKVLGLTMNETIAILTTMREATGRTGKEVGNALNSILSFMQRPTAIKAFETEGIQVFADEARTQFRNVIEIFDEMSQKWPQMGEASRNAFADQAEAAGLYSEEMAEVMGMEEQYNDIQQRNLSQAAAGIYRRNYLLALLQNWSKVDEVLISQENSLGYSMKENERTMQTLEKQIEVMKASAEQLAVALGDAGLLNELTGLIEGVTDAVQWFNNLDDSTQTLLLTVLEVTVAVKLLSVAFKGLGLAGLGAGVGKFAEMAKGVTSVASAATLAGTAAKGLGKGIVGALGGPWAVAAIAIGTSVSFIARETNKANDELQEHAAMAEGLIGEYDNLTNKLNGMTKGTDEYNKAAKELYGLKSNIADSLPELIDGWDSETESLKINRQEMQNMIDAGKDLKKTKEELAASDAEIAKIQEERKASENKVQEWESEINVLNDLAERREKLTKALAAQKEGSEEAKKTEEALGETERLIADIAEEAGLKRNATIDAIIDKIKDERIAEAGRVKQKYADERELVAAAKQGALDRLKILSEEIAANKSLLPGGKWYEYRPVFLKGKYNYLPGGEGWARSGLSDDQEEAVRQQEIVNSKNAELNKLDKAIKSAERNISSIKTDSVLGTGGGTTGGGSKGKDIDSIAEAFKRLADSANQYELANMGIESALASVNNQLSISDAEYEYLNSRVETGSATMADYARMQELVTQKSSLLSSEQVKLASANQQYQQQITALTPLLAKATSEYERFKAAGDEEHTKDAADAVSSLRSEIDSLSGAIASNTAKIWENKSAIEELSRTTYTAYYQQAMSWAQHMESMGRMTNEQQIDYLQTIDQTRLALSDQWQLQEKLFGSLKDQMSEYLDQLDSERDSALDVIETRVDTTVAGLQAQIDALDQEEKADNRADALTKHNEKLAKLQEDRRYHELRTGAEHAEAIAKIDEQIAEENRDFQQQQEDWVRDDKKESLQQQIEDAKEAGETEKQNLTKHYNDVKKLVNDNMNGIINGLMSKQDQWQATGKALIDAMIAGLKSGDFSGVKSLIDSVGVSSSGSDYGKPVAPGASTTTEPASSGTNDWFASEIAYLSSLKQTGDAGQQAWANQMLYLVKLAQSGDAGQKIWARSEAANMGVTIPEAHIGALTEKEGLAKLRYDERILSPRLTVSFDRLAAVLNRTPDVTSRIGGGSDFNAAANRIVAAIERKMNVRFDNLVNIENYVPQDVVDIDILSRETARQVGAII